MEKRIFHIALLISLIIHVVLIVFLSIERVKKLQEEKKKLEVIYQQIAMQQQLVDKAKPLKDFRIAAEEKKGMDVPVLQKDFDSPEAALGKIKDLSRMIDPAEAVQEKVSTIKPSDLQRKITVPLVETEKITNPKYLTYNQGIREKIKQRAYQFIDNPEFEAGEVYLTFVLQRNGVLRDLQIIEAKTNANEYLKRAGLRSVRESNPFPPFPKDLNYPELTFNVVISFEVE